MKYQEKSVEELLFELHELDQVCKQKPLYLKIDQFGTILLDETNEADREWYENDSDYDVV
ncbi:hypothetical protein [Pseudobacillus badius]|uniref:hypothetical protein n=1 Tax=Bacillus badius TaxID=1455 RepID=UPI0007B3D5C2|nr:hypothetical protein [Bacillus badius]KZR60597.1 hypothetical protein A3781_06845 [Bacillus badius]MED0668490.1 hypothetical protein [Bacillus badius]